MFEKIKLTKDQAASLTTCMESLVKDIDNLTQMLEKAGIELDEKTVADLRQFQTTTLAQARMHGSGNDFVAMSILPVVRAAALKSIETLKKHKNAVEVEIKHDADIDDIVGMDVDDLLKK